MPIDLRSVGGPAASGTEAALGSPAAAMPARLVELAFKKVRREREDKGVFIFSEEYLGYSRPIHKIVVMPGHHDVGQAGNLVHRLGGKLKIHAVVITPAFPPEINRGDRITGNDDRQARTIESQAMMTPGVPRSWNNLHRFEEAPGDTFHRFR